MTPGAPALDAPLGAPSRQAWLLDQLGGSFVAVYYCGRATAAAGGVSSKA